jgi:hypothetical protein
MNTITIRSLVVGVSILGASAFIASATSFAQQIGQPIAAVPPFTLDFDEAGNSLLNGLPNPNLVNPVAGGGIQFYLPGIVQPGQVLITSPIDVNSANPNGDSDLLTFSNGPGLNGALVGIMLYESLIDDATETDLADVPRLNYLAPILTILETGPEGANGFSYIVPGASYIGLSDGYLPTPEPSTFGMAGMGLLCLAALAYRRRLAKARLRSQLRTFASAAA